MDAALNARSLLETILALTLASVLPAVAQTATAVEYYNPAWDAYFVSAFPHEIQLLDDGAFGGVWKRAGKTFEVWIDSTGGAIPVNPTCRFFSTAFAPYSTHFYTPLADECAMVKQDPNWQFEADAFFLGVPNVEGNCPSDSLPLYRLYNNGQRGVPNHRYSNDPSVFEQMVAVGWTPEGNATTGVFACVPGKVLNIVMVPLRYQSPPSADPLAVAAYNDSLPKITQQGLQSMGQILSAWWRKVSYGTQEMRFTVLPEVTLPGNPTCAVGTINSDAAAAAAAAGFTTYASYDALVGVAPYSCWKSKGSTGGKRVAIWNTVSTDGPALFAHEIGHALGMLHNAAMMPTYSEYGSEVDQMGTGNDFITLRDLAADHKHKMGILKNPLPCKSATLRSILDHPDAIQCGAWFIDYIGNWRDEVWVHKREWKDGGGGGSDTTDYAHLKVGQSYRIADGPTITYNGAGAVSITP